MTTDSRPSTSRRVLVVEDDRDLRDLLVQLISIDGFDVRAVDNGRDALEHLRTAERPGLILLDLMMPIVDGFAFLRAQHATPELRDIPVIVLSALDRVPAAEFTDLEFLSKPLDFDRLLALVRARCR